MTSAVYDNAIVHFGISEINWSNGQNDIYCVLCTNTPPTKTHSHYSSIQGQLLSGNGYTQGGNVMTLATPTLDSNKIKFDADNVDWPGASFTAHYAIVYHNAGTPPLISYHDFGSDKSITNGRFTVEWAYDGVFHLISEAQS